MPGSAGGGASLLAAPLLGNQSYRPIGAEGRGVDLGEQGVWAILHCGQAQEPGSGLGSSPAAHSPFQSQASFVHL